ncbi:Ribosomal protein S18 acetylase RimI [Apiospora phragmitis]|uniref:Ribosomal protein S18 acetylase RimI n=1 Tax=Apiospora phragmitis TaxID=2905665 RepID=A0ABR1WTW2_9PEZI
MSFAVLPALIPDITPVYDVYFAAFKDEKIFEYIYPDGVNRNEHRQWMTDQWGIDPNEYTLKCVEPATGQIVGMATFEVYWNANVDTETSVGMKWKRPDGDFSRLNGFEKQRLEIVMGALWNMRENIIGNRRHVYCLTMAVQPGYQRKGVGTLLLNWGIDLADRLDVPIYLESTITARHFYKRFGFDIPEFVIHKAEVIGDDRDDIVPIMVRMPKNHEGLSVGEWQAMVDAL